MTEINKYDILKQQQDTLSNLERDLYRDQAKYAYNEHGCFNLNTLILYGLISTSIMYVNDNIQGFVTNYRKTRTRND